MSRDELIRRIVTAVTILLVLIVGVAAGYLIPENIPAPTTTTLPVCGPDDMVGEALGRCIPTTTTSTTRPQPTTTSTTTRATTTTTMATDGPTTTTSTVPPTTVPVAIDLWEEARWVNAWPEEPPSLPVLEATMRVSNALDMASATPGSTQARLYVCFALLDLLGTLEFDSLHTGGSEWDWAEAGRMVEATTTFADHVCDYFN